MDDVIAQITRFRAGVLASAAALIAANEGDSPTPEAGL
jgi:flagellar protein FlbD